MLSIKRVDVMYSNQCNGETIPLQIYLDHKWVLIDRIIEKKPAFSEAGGYGICYVIEYQHHLGKLFFMQDHYELEYTVDPSEVVLPKPGIVADPRH